LKLDNGIIIYSGEKSAGKNREDKKSEAKGHFRFHILPTPDNKPVSFMATGPSHLVFICNGKMHVMGDNSYKQLGIVVLHHQEKFEEKVR
jgi:hypothetical protein